MMLGESGQGEAGMHLSLKIGPLVSKLPGISHETPILYVEDEEADAYLMRIALTRAGIPNPLKVVVDGVMAIDYLAGAGPFADRTQYPFPALVLLDLNVPRKSGFEVLKWIREQPAHSTLPVIVFTSSTHEKDRENAWQLGASEFITKMSDVNQLVALLRTICQHWLQQPHC